MSKCCKSFLSIFLFCGDCKTLKWMMMFKHKIIITEAAPQRCSMKRGALRNFAKFTGKRLCQSLFFNKVAGLRPATLLKKRLWHRRFPVNFAKFLRISFLQNTSGRLLL